MSIHWARILLLLLGMAPLCALAEDVIRVGFDDHSVPPYYLGDGPSLASPNPGLSVEIIRAAAEGAGLKVVFSRQPWLRCLENLREGQIDALFNASFRSDRTRYGVYPGNGVTPNHDLRIATMSYSFVRIKNAPVHWNGSELSGNFAPIGVVHGFSVAGDLKDRNWPTQETGSTDQLMKMLEAGRVPIAALQTQTVTRLLENGHYPGLELVTPPFLIKDYFVMLSRDFIAAHPAKAELFWAKIGEFRESMSARLLEKYMD